MNCKAYIDNGCILFVTIDIFSGQPYGCYRSFEDLLTLPLFITQAFKINTTAPGLSHEPFYEFDTNNPPNLPELFPEIFI